ncbi:helix-turn-helix transcriptional regulator [Flavobacterium sp. JLP]|uniref:helix-turn-helix domain-containing protein n=1 Tax=unclassified Flavobacterium TaxID=196869 RepID=UPI00188D447C|nr:MULTISPECIES: AraC family transcriptional regulator [unclassified Flavobacterium]MBF4494773.1 helix-turn-helix transcriptional regulator [Flavobacterium sp. MR2016-29]MBF4507848.1 helix-turn-helix transcriptional regulator [Flavobacterium sp. JLP]
MKKITHFYSLGPEWQNQLAEEMGTKVVDDKIIVVPENIGRGHTYFTQITSGISALFFDIEFNTPVKITRLKSDHYLYIFHYDLSEHVNLIKINNKDYEIGSFDKLDLAIIDNKLESSFKPAVNERTIALRILVDKNLLNDFTEKYPSKEITKNKGKSTQNTLYHYGNIDSNSLLLIQAIKSKSIYDLSFDSFLKGVSLKLLGNFFNKFYNIDTAQNEITDVEIEAITKTKNYLLDNLYGPFPSIAFLSALAGMSDSKYKMLFKKYFKDTPNNLFIVEKMRLAKNLLQSGKFNTLTEIIYELNYNKLTYFSSKYYALFKRKPSEDFVKKLS